MPGAALWLVPPDTPPFPSSPAVPSSPATTPLTTRLQTLITATLPAAHPGLCHAVPFVPHLTLTSGLDPETYAADPQAWLDALPLGEEENDPLPRVRFGPLRTRDAFLRRAAVDVAPAGVRPLARAVREAVRDGEAAEAELASWEPHLSLVYGDKPIDEATLAQMVQTVRDAGVRLGDAGEEKEGESSLVPENGGWEGGAIWLVPTYEEIGKWKPIACRIL